MSGLFPTPESLAEGRSLLALEIPPTRRKQLGQCFTGLRTGRLLAALAVRHGQKRIVDPMAGHGDLLESVAERASLLRSDREELFGVEIEPQAARLGDWRVKQCAKEFGFAHERFVHGDAFAFATWRNCGQFDLVITNPPYVRYQTLSNGGSGESGKPLNAEATRQALERLADRISAPEERFIWRRLIRSYSGLADLSVPSWLLCGLLTAPSGVLALVVPQTWLNRDYARIARYFFLRFFRPLAVVQESGQRWFRDVLVPVSLVVGQRLSTAEALIPLSRRTGFGFLTPFAELEVAAACARSHVGNAFPGDDPEGDFAKWLREYREARTGIQLRRVTWQSQRDEALAASRGAKWLSRLEGDFLSSVVHVTSTSVFPAAIAQHLPQDYLRRSQPLSSQPIRVGQGLRTGCNAFFYVEITGDVTAGEFVSVVTHEIFGGRRIDVPASALKPVLRRQKELSKIRIFADSLRGRLLDLRGFVLPENAPRTGSGNKTNWQLIPDRLAEHVRKAAQTYMVRGESMTAIPSLSAVKPNGMGPDERIGSRLLLGEVAVRMWYMVPDFSPRHFGAVCVPRIIHDEPRAILNSDPPVLIDANFSTLWCYSGEWSSQMLFAVLNSTWGELCMEALGSTLGGGALKLEATHLRELPMPPLSVTQRQELESLVREASEARCSWSEFQHYRFRIDQIVVSALAGRTLMSRETRRLLEKLESVVGSLRAKRRRNRGPAHP
jgi:hypothetical protein